MPSSGSWTQSGLLAKPECDVGISGSNFDLKSIAILGPKVPSGHRRSNFTLFVKQPLTLLMKCVRNMTSRAARSVSGGVKGLLTYGLVWFGSEKSVPQFPSFDLYATLYLPHDAAQEDVRAHYIKIMRGNHMDHPDFIARIKQKYPAQIEETETEYRERIAGIAKSSVQRFNAAYEILYDPAQRKAYDRHISNSKGSQTTFVPTRSETPCAQTDPELNPSDRHFFKRKSQAEKQCRRTWSEASSGREKYCFWK